MAALVRPGSLQALGSRGGLWPHKGPGVCWCVGSFLWAVRETCALQPAEVLPVPSHELADFSLNAYIILAWLLKVLGNAC